MSKPYTIYGEFGDRSTGELWGAYLSHNNLFDADNILDARLQRDGDTFEVFAFVNEHINMFMLNKDTVCYGLHVVEP